MFALIKQRILLGIFLGNKIYHKIITFLFFFFQKMFNARNLSVVLTALLVIVVVPDVSSYSSKYPLKSYI